MAKQIILTKRDGRLAFSEEPAAVFDFLSNGEYVITIKRSSTKRNIAQNNLMWMWLTCIERETGTSKDDVYMYYCKKFLMKTISIGDKLERIYNTSSKLNTEQMTQFLTNIQQDALNELGIRLPRPEDRFFEAFYNQFNY
jgi:hypothetical protein